MSVSMLLVQQLECNDLQSLTDKPRPPPIKESLPGDQSPAAYATIVTLHQDTQLYQHWEGIARPVIMNHHRHDI